MMKRSLSVSLVLLFVLGVSGCGLVAKDDPARDLVEDFFALLESGHTSEIASLLVEDSPLLENDRSMLSDDLYEASTARPVNVTVDSGVVDRDRLLVPVSYKLEGTSERRTTTFVLVRVGDELKIDSWGDYGVRLSSDLPGIVEVNGVVRTRPLAEHPSLVALPGVYELQYVDPEGLGAVVAKRGGPASLSVEFPFDDQRQIPEVSEQIDIDGDVISFKPKLATGIDNQIWDASQVLSRKCESEGLIGESCPEVLVARVNGFPGKVRQGSTTWTVTENMKMLDGPTWTFSLGLRVSWGQDDRDRTLTSPFRGEVVPDGEGGVSSVKWLRSE